ncbi:MAG: MBL fold metallo-hydrolase [Clostridiales bacterium]|jgi:glyoxylase-like metal-dependent hydrolase (beta-lactamase superfamily II)|nr:MBL fold metallo-hydrolase [Clostridiales bacterium]
MFNFIYDWAAGAYARGKGMNPACTGQITEDITAVKTGCVNFYLYRKGGGIIAIDAGFGKGVIRRELARLGIRPDSVSALFLTHSDIDHADGVSVFKNASVYLSADEERMIRRETARKFGFIYNAELKMPYGLLRQDDEIRIGPIKVRAIETPGHTPGSMCYLVDEAFLFSGDAFNLISGKAYPISKRYTMDQKQQIMSIKKLAGLKGVRAAFTAHWGYTEKFGDVTANYR